MPRTRSLAWSELKIGVLTIFAIVIVAITIFMLTGGKGFFWQRYSLKTRFTNVAGLKPGSPVRVAGKEVGTVTEIDFAGEQIDVTFEVNKEIRDQITTESVATLGSVSLLGEGAVDITPSTAGTPVPEWGYVKTGRTPAQIADITEQASQGMAMLNRLVAGLSAGQGTVGKLLTDDRLYLQLQQFVGSRQPDGAQRPAGPRHRRQAAERSADGQRARGVAEERRRCDATPRGRRGQPRQAAQGRCVFTVFDRGDRQHADS